MSSVLTESTGLSPRPEQYRHSTFIRKRGAGASPQLTPSAHDGDKGYAVVSTPMLEEGWVGPHKNDDILSPDLRDFEDGRTAGIARAQLMPEGDDFNINSRFSRMGVSLSHSLTHQPRSGAQTPTADISLSDVPTPSSASPFNKASSTAPSSAWPVPPSRSHSGGSSRPTSLSGTPSKQIPRLPTPDFSKLRNSGSYKHAFATPLNFLRGGSGGASLEGDERFSRSGTDGQVPVGRGYLERFHIPHPTWNWSWMWGPNSGRDPTPLVARTDTGGSTGSCSTTGSSSSSIPTSSRTRSSGLIATEEELGYRHNRHHSLTSTRGIRRYAPSLHVPTERPLSSVFEDDSSDEELLHKSERKRRRWRESTLSRLFPRPPPHRYPTLKSPNPNNHHDRPSFASSSLSSSTNSESCTLADILPSLQETSARFTHKFPWGANGSGAQFVRLNGGEGEKENSVVDAIGVTLSEAGEGGFGVEGVGRWNGFKWTLMLSVIGVFLMGLTTLLLSLYTWFGAWSHARAVITVEYNLLIFATLAASTLILSSLLGISGTLLNSRPILAFYSLLLWPSFVSVLIVGYTAYKRRTFNLSGKLSQSWNQMMDDNDRAIIQNTFQCCGFISPKHDFALTATCFPRAPLRGCLEALAPWEAMFLEKVYMAVFATVPLIVANIVISLLCSNHVNRTFGKGLTPKAYRLSLADVQANAEKIMLKVSSTRIPHEPERLLSKQVRSTDEGDPALRGNGRGGVDHGNERI